MKSFSVFLVFVFIATIPLAADPISVQCMDDPAYSQVFGDFDGALPADTNSDLREIADNYNASAPFDKIRLFGANFVVSIGSSQTFVIKIYDGPPLSGGNLVHMFTKSGTPVYTGYNSQAAPIYYIDIDFGVVVSQLIGWVGITRVYPSDGANFYGNLYAYSGNNQAFNHADNKWYQGSNHLFFCLGKASQPVPVKNWSVYIGMVLIVGFLVMGFRRYF